MNQTAATPLNRALLDTLVCPVSKGPLTYDPASQELRCVASQLAYPVRNGIPVLLEAEARELSADEVEALRS